VVCSRRTQILSPAIVISVFFATPYILPRSPGKNASGKPVRIKYRLIIARVMFVRGCDRIYENFTTHILGKRETLLNPRMIG